MSMCTCNAPFDSLFVEHQLTRAWTCTRCRKDIPDHVVHALATNDFKDRLTVAHRKIVMGVRITETTAHGSTSIAGELTPEARQALSTAPPKVTGLPVAIVRQRRSWWRKIFGGP